MGAVSCCIWEAPRKFRPFQWILFRLGPIGQAQKEEMSE